MHARFAVATALLARSGAAGPRHARNCEKTLRNGPSTIRWIDDEEPAPTKSG